jgi:8-oxo-dGTP pyrophosphatase MutT (NUDIX family)
MSKVSEAKPKVPAGEVVNPNNLRVVARTVASAVIVSADGKILMGRKDPNRGGVYANAWHIPGGGVNEHESLEAAARRESSEEVKGIDFSTVTYTYLSDHIGHGGSEKTLESGERIWADMAFHRFEVQLDQAADAYQPTPGDDLVELRWFSWEELAGAELIPGGKEFFVAAGYL